MTKIQEEGSMKSIQSEIKEIIIKEKYLKHACRQDTSFLWTTMTFRC